MKKAKFLIYAALAASTVAISSCSDNDVLSEPANEPEGKALIVNPTVLDSRVTPLAKSAFTGFKLYGVQNPNISNQSEGSFIKTGTTNGVDYSGTFGETAADVAFTSTTAVKWPTKYPDNSANFYAFSVQGGSDLTGSGITVNEDEYGTLDGTFSYTAPVDGDGNVDLSKQKDIMIASSLDAVQTDNNGVVTLPFKHAFAKLTFQIRWNAYEYLNGANTPIKGSITPYARLYVKYIKFHNIKCNGTYDFTADDGNGGKGKWTVDGEKSTITYEFATPMEFTATNVTSTAANPFEVQDLLVGDKSIMILPQTVGAYTTITKNTAGGVFTASSNAYLELGLFSYGMQDKYSTYLTTDEDIQNYYKNVSISEDLDMWDDEDPEHYPIFYIGFGNYEETMEFHPAYIPIKGSSETFAFEANKSYNFRLALSQALDDKGEKVLGSVTIQN